MHQLTHDLAERADLIQSVKPAQNITIIVSYLLAALAGLLIGMTL